MDSLDLTSTKSSKIVHWFNRSYPVRVQWTKFAITTYIECEGNAELARSRIVAHIRSHFLDTPPQMETIQRWTKELRETIDVVFRPPVITEDEAASVNWEQVADYLLLPCGSTLNEIDEANAEREELNRKELKSYCRQFVVSGSVFALKKDPTLSDSKLLEIFAEKKATQPMIKEARKILRAGIESHPLEAPTPLELIGLYESNFY